MNAPLHTRTLYRPFSSLTHAVCAPTHSYLRAVYMLTHIYTRAICTFSLLHIHKVYTHAHTHTYAIHTLPIPKKEHVIYTHTVSMLPPHAGYAPKMHPAHTSINTHSLKAYIYSIRLNQADTEAHTQSSHAHTPAAHSPRPARPLLRNLGRWHGDDVPEGAVPSIGGPGGTALGLRRPPRRCHSRRMRRALNTWCSLSFCLFAKGQSAFAKRSTKHGEGNTCCWP